MFQVTVLPGELQFHVEAGTPVRELLLREGILLDFPCGGRGLCNQCRVVIDPPIQSGRGGRRNLPAQELEQGYRLACQSVVEGDCSISIPQEKALEVAWRDPAAVEAPQSVYGQRVISRRRLKLSAPSLADQRADWERLVDALDGAPMPPMRPVVAEGFAHALRAGSWDVEALFEDGELLCLRSKPEEPVYGFAVDLGTTTVDISLHNLESGRLIGRKALLNRQTAFGADVISRAHNYQEKGEEVRAAALQTIDECARMLLEEAGVSPERVVRTTVVGNPIMIHILHGLNPRQLTLAPYIPLVSGPVRRPPEDFRWSFQGCGFVETLPLVSAFVGADTVGMILALDLEHERETSLSIDIGTNGEMVLARAGELLTTSTAAGPAFEGAQIACGMRALAGAVTRVAIAADGTVGLTVVGGGKPKGICGSGLISATAELLEAGVLEETGRLAAPEEVSLPLLRQRLFHMDKMAAFRLSPDVYITQRDIRELQLAKAAIRTGIDLLLVETGVQLDELGRIRLAGNFGSGVDIPATIRLGLIPMVPVEKVDVVGNAALRGASLALISREYRRRAAAVHRHCRFLELAARPDFQTRFSSALMF
jgi:uncharacterized 2Fe-2S/4Fe-4S cluster protein (DUF4445 family)